ncbi:MAG: hypothetical protein ABJB05_10465 [Parafilimonas sp.]
MSDDKINQGAYSTVNADEERDLAAKGGPTTGLGIADDKHGISAPYDSDILTQLAAKSTANKKETDKLDNKNENK